jgi:tRNA(Ile)-lysidine synthase
VRNWRPGDQYRPIGHASAIKIKDLFQKARIPLWERRRWPVITCQDSIVWAARFGPAAELAADPGTRTLLTVRQLGEDAEL